MERDEFAQLKNFKLNEKDIRGRLITARLLHIDSTLMIKADYMVSTAKEYFHPKAYFIVHDINLGEHNDGSQHYLGKAIDGHFERLTVPQMFWCAQLAGFKGIGAYGGDVWDNPGIHADVRDQEQMSVWYAWEDLVWDASIGENVPKIQYRYNRADVYEYLFTEC